MNHIRNSIESLVQQIGHARSRAAGLSEGSSVGELGDEFLRQVETSWPAGLGAQADSSLAGEFGIRDVPGELARELEFFYRHVASSGFPASSGNFFGYIPGGGLPVAAVADYHAALTNRYAGSYLASPGAGEVEKAVIEWARGVVGFPATAWGSTQSGGTLATMSALVVARDRLVPREWSRAVVYHTSEVHDCLRKALHTVGMGQAERRLVAVDSFLRMDAEALHAAIEDDKRNGKLPWLVVATAGTTNCGAIDPLVEIAEIAQRHGAWLHIDGAYGGFFSLVPELKHQLRGLALADSIVLDPHKALFQPYGIGMVLVRDGQLLRNSFAASGAYLQEIKSVDPSPSDYSLELTRPFRALRLWLSLRVHGEAQFCAALREKWLLAEYAYQRLVLCPDVEVLATAESRPALSLVCFAGKTEAATEALSKRLRQMGKSYFSTTQIHGRTWIRMCILSFRSHLEHVEAALEAIESAAAG